MRGILPMGAEWSRRGRPFAMATLVAVSGSAPREVGASMIVSADGEVFGNVSGGCVEGAVFEQCLHAIQSGSASVETFGYSSAAAFSVGLSCGGVIEVLVRPVLPGSAAAADVLLLAEREARAMPASYTLTVAGADVGRGVIDQASPPSSGAVTIALGSPPRLIIVGAVEFAVALSRIAIAAGMQVTVVDPREVFATTARFPGAEVVVAWPHRYLETAEVDARTAVCVLTHDPKFDVPALRVALASAAGYVGVMGSRRTHEERLERLTDTSAPAAEAVPAEQLERLRSPIGLDLGGRSPEETALSILAEIVADRHGASGRRLSELSGPVHRPLGARVAS
ncbi:XdhC family protein [Pseudoclavibacter sp. VKM Ac-2888]|uniref:XdhC family protein n=1 Tax=Pseudoclavibacter sp. VKM Ac-2888 TaxID=2783830 RepID=UPI00188BA494|nr:XdhC family protein [Pseudoclavibacter sp. VKM Ac-2888]MBF4550797.1 XdhC family protein [Pseudoclavibacter sp. VKM Ac-2888]